MTHALSSLGCSEADMMKANEDARWAAIKPLMWMVRRLDADEQAEFQRDLESVWDAAIKYAQNNLNAEGGQ